MSQPVLFIGESGTAKSVPGPRCSSLDAKVTMQNTLESFPSDASVILNINYSSRTSSLDFQRTMEDNISKRTGRIFGPDQARHDGSIETAWRGEEASDLHRRPVHA